MPGVGSVVPSHRVPVLCLVWASIALGPNGCSDPPAPRAVAVEPAQDPEQVTEDRSKVLTRELERMVRRCEAGETCPPPGSPARRVCTDVDAIPMHGERLQAFGSDDPEAIAAATKSFADALEKHEQVARPGGVDQTDAFADSAATARRDLLAATDPAVARQAIMRHLEQLGHLRRWCAIGDADLPGDSE